MLGGAVSVKVIIQQRQLTVFSSAKFVIGATKWQLDFFNRPRNPFDEFEMTEQKGSTAAALPLRVFARSLSLVARRPLLFLFPSHSEYCSTSALAPILTISLSFLELRRQNWSLNGRRSQPSEYRGAECFFIAH